MNDSPESVDVIVIGMGVGGEAVAGSLLSEGLSVIGVESQLVGGECPYWGCVPSKMMIRAAHTLAEAGRVDALAGAATVSSDWAPVAQRIREEATDNWDDKVAVDRFVDQGGQFLRGRARIVGPGRVDVDGRVYEASRGVVLATGTVPAVPPVPGLDQTPFWTNREAVEVTTLPSSLIVLGGGAIGLELAQVFARFGVAVTVVEVADRLLAAEEPEASRVVHDALVEDGLSVHVGAEVGQISHDGSTFTVQLGGGESLSAEQLLVATGRRVDLTGLGVDTLGLDPEARQLTVDEQLRAGEKLWGVGDVTGRGAFTHIATYQARILVRSILGEPGPPADYSASPRVTFTDPEVGAVGLTEAQAREQGMAVRTGVAQVPSTARGWIHKAGNAGVIKLVVDRDSDVIVGATSAGPNGGEVLGALAVAVHGKVPVERLRHMIYAYPTFHRGIEDALGALSD